jgi:hypothetical protein
MTMECLGSTGTFADGIRGRLCISIMVSGLLIRQKFVGRHKVGQKQQQQLHYIMYSAENNLDHCHQVFETTFQRILKIINLLLFS